MTSAIVKSDDEKADTDHSAVVLLTKDPAPSVLLERVYADAREKSDGERTPQKRNRSRNRQKRNQLVAREAYVEINSKKSGQQKG